MCKHSMALTCVAKNVCIAGLKNVEHQVQGKEGGSPSNNSNYIPCTLPLIVVIFGGCLTTTRNLFAIPKRRDSFGMRWLKMSPENMLKYLR